jgi:hypothetical protein
MNTLGGRQKRRRRIWAGALAMIGVAVVSGWAPALAASDNPLEYAVKATYLYKLPPFVEWPPAAHAGPSSPFNLCIVGDDPFGDTLDRAVLSQRVGERGFTVLRLRLTDSAQACHIMYVSGPSAQLVADALSKVRGRPVLTVTDSVAEPQAKGIVNFLIRDGRVRFEIDDRAAAENSLSISSKLLSLAVSTRRRD